MNCYKLASQLMDLGIKNIGRVNIMAGTLTDAELEELAELGSLITIDLSCDVNGTGVPCRTDRLAAVEHMKRYLEIHDIHIQQTFREWQDEYEGR